MGFIYITEAEAIAINERITGVRGLLRDANLLSSAMSRPEMAAYYSQAELDEQFVLLVEGLALNHPFQDGNKRTATIVGVTFLAANGAIIASSGDELGQQVEALVITRNTSAFLIWVKKHLVIQ